MWWNEHELKPIGDKFKGGKIVLQMFLQKEEQDANLAIWAFIWFTKCKVGHEIACDYFWAD
jgi:hypothetical protein